MNEATKAIIKATAPVLKEHGEAIKHTLKHKHYLKMHLLINIRN